MRRSTILPVLWNTSVPTMGWICRPGSLPDFVEVLPFPVSLLTPQTHWEAAASEHILSSLSCTTHYLSSFVLRLSLMKLPWQPRREHASPEPLLTRPVLHILDLRTTVEGAPNALVLLGLLLFWLIARLWRRSSRSSSSRLASSWGLSDSIDSDLKARALGFRVFVRGDTNSSLGPQSLLEWTLGQSPLRRHAQKVLQAVTSLGTRLPAFALDAVMEEVLRPDVQDVEMASEHVRNHLLQLGWIVKDTQNMYRCIDASVVEETSDDWVGWSGPSQTLSVVSTTVAPTVATPQPWHRPLAERWRQQLDRCGSLAPESPFLAEHVPRLCLQWRLYDLALQSSTTLCRTLLLYHDNRTAVETWLQFCDTLQRAATQGLSSKIPDCDAARLCMMECLLEHCESTGTIAAGTGEAFLRLGTALSRDAAEECLAYAVDLLKPQLKDSLRGVARAVRYVSLVYGARGDEKSAEGLLRLYAKLKRGSLEVFVQELGTASLSQLVVPPDDQGLCLSIEQLRTSLKDTEDAAHSLALALEAAVCCDDSSVVQDLWLLSSVCVRAFRSLSS